MPENEADSKPRPVRRVGLFRFRSVPEWPNGDSMQEDLRGAESRYAGLPGFESQRCNLFAGLRTTYTGLVPLGAAPATYSPDASALHASAISTSQ